MSPASKIEQPTEEGAGSETGHKQKDLERRETAVSGLLGAGRLLVAFGRFALVILVVITAFLLFLES